MAVKRCVHLKFSHPERDVLEVEKRNLLALAKLVVRDVIESSMIKGRMLDSDHVPLQVSSAEQSLF
jgi:hypothetical protein